MMPWQRYVADVSHEVDPATGLLVYREVVITIPRQSGKTTLGLAVKVNRALAFGGRQQIVYTAQTRNDARKKWEDEHWPILEASPFGPLVRIRRRTGAEAFLWSNGSTHSVLSTTKKAGHGPTVDLADVDESFAQEDDRIEQALRPAMITRPQPQFWTESTAGTAESVYLRGKVETGRRRVESGQPSTSCYFEWSAPNEADPLDPATWWACMPALGHTISESAIRAELAGMIEEGQREGTDGLRLFRRAYLNQWVDEFDLGWLVIKEAEWNARGGATERPSGAVVFAADAAWPHAEMGAIAVAGWRGGELIVQIVDHRPGTSWIPGRLAELQQRHDPEGTWVDRKGPLGFLIADIEAEGVQVLSPKLEDVCEAAGVTYAAVAGDAPVLRHFGQPEFGAAVAAADKRDVGDAWTWVRKGAADISPLTAATLAAWAAPRDDSNAWGVWG